MNPERLVAGLDIGSAKTTAIIAETTGELPKHPAIKLLGVGQARTTGMRRGVVSDIEETTRSIRQALQDAERMAGTPMVDALPVMNSRPRLLKTDLACWSASACEPIGTVT